MIILSQIVRKSGSAYMIRGINVKPMYWELQYVHTIQTRERSPLTHSAPIHPMNIVILASRENCGTLTLPVCAYRSPSFGPL